MNDQDTTIVNAQTVGVVVVNLATKERMTYVGITPREAAVAAFAYSIGDHNTWGYMGRYGSKVVEAQFGFVCGDWYAFKTKPAA